MPLHGKVPLHLFPQAGSPRLETRGYSTRTDPDSARLTHVNASGQAHMVDVGAKEASNRTAVARGTVYFSEAEPLRLIRENSNKKGDVLSTARIAGIMAAKRCADIIPLCHPIPITKVSVDLVLGDSKPVETREHTLLDVRSTEDEQTAERTDGGPWAVHVEAVVQCHGPTGVEMEALTAVMGACLTVYDMCKAVDKKMSISDVRVVYKEGGRSGTFMHEDYRAELGR